jgi:hypothetical protein
LALSVPAALAWRRFRRGSLSAAGLLLCLAVIIGLLEVESFEAVVVPPALVYGLGLLAATGLVAGVLRLPLVVGMGLALPGAWLIATDADLVDVGWIRLLVGVGAAVGGGLAADFDRRWRAVGAPPVLFAVSAAGVYMAVPETDPASVLLGVALPVVLLGWPRAIAGLGSAGAFAAIGLLAWTVGVGGSARPSSIVGGLGCLGLFVVEPLAHVLTRGPSGPEGIPRWWSLTSMVGVHVALTAIASRAAGLQTATGKAALIVLAELVIACALVVVGGNALRARAIRLDLEPGGSS